MVTRTKIVCTMGPAVSSYEKIVALLQAGMNVARLNFSHGSQEEHRKVIENLKRARKELRCPLSIMLDMKGPKIRVQTIGGREMSLTQGQIVRLSQAKEDIGLHPSEALSVLRSGMSVLFDDGYIVGKVLTADAKGATVEIQNNGLLKNGKGIHIPGATIPLPAMSEEDMRDLKFGCQEGIDWVAASFVRSAEHVRSMKDFLAKQGHPHLPLISKIESTEGIQNFDGILAASDGIMVARGDLGVEVDLALVPPLQKMMIRKCYQAGKPVITATQMLESMISHPRPTRAEVSDVANAIYDGSSAVMLSAETAIGTYPVETVSFMRHIAEKAEADVDYRRFLEESSILDRLHIAGSVSFASVRTAYSANAKAIFCLGDSEEIIHLACRFKPAIPLIAVASNEKQYHQLGAIWGVVPVLCIDPQKAISTALHFALNQNMIRKEDVIVLALKWPPQHKGVMNTMIVDVAERIIAHAPEWQAPR